MKKCGTCFRYCENWRDARAKGLQERHTGVFDYHYKPRKGVKPHCIGGKVREGINEKHPACEYHEYRWFWNFKTWWNWHAKQLVIELYRKHIRVPIGGLRKPVQLNWIPSYDGMTDKIIPFGEPECPHCKEMPYSYTQCVFCGQKFLPDDNRPDKTAPQRKRLPGEPIIFVDGICPECGRSCGNGGYGPLRCSCGWVGKTVFSKELQSAIDEMFEEGEHDA